MPSNQTPLGALPARFRRQRVLIIGCGDVGQRVLRAHAQGVQMLALTSQAAHAPKLRAQGARVLQGDLDDACRVQRLAGVAHRVLHLAPPPAQGVHDTRTATLVRALRRRTPPQQVVYGSTSGVYGDCQGAWVHEHRSTAPQTDRAQRRVDAERWMRHWGAGGATRVSILRIPGIYALDREGGTPRERLLRGTPVLRAQDDVYTNHIHAEDLARACWLALWRGRAQRVVHASDDTQMTMGEYMCWAAQLWRMPEPARISLAQAAQELPPMLLSFMRESRRLDNTRLKRELRLRLRYPTVREGLRA